MGFFVGKKELAFALMFSGVCLSIRFFNSISYVIRRKNHSDYIHSMQNKDKKLLENYKKS